MVSKIIAVVLLCLSFQSATFAGSQAYGNKGKLESGIKVPGNNPDEGNFNVRDYNAKGDGTTDDTYAIQAAINAAGKTGGRVYLPPARYLVRESLQVLPGVSVIGSANMPQYSDPLIGTIILATVGRDNEAAPALFELGSCSSVSGLTIYYPEQKVTDIHPYSWTFHLQGNDNTLENVTLINSYNGIKVGPEANVRHRIRSVVGCVLRRGLLVDGCTDIGRVENVQFHGHWWWAGSVNGNIDLVNDYMIKNLEAFIFGRTDWEYVTNTFVFPVKIGYRFIETSLGACNGQFSGIGADMAQRCVVVDQIQPMGLLITNGQFVAFAGNNPVEIEISPACTGQVRLVNCAFWGPAVQNVVSHSQSFLSMSDCYFSSEYNSPAPLVEADGGRLQIHGCSFAGKKPAVAIRKGVVYAIVSENNGTNGVEISNEIGEAAVIINNEPRKTFPYELIPGEKNIKYLKASPVKDLKPGVSYNYYEGAFKSTSQLATAEIVKSGTLKNISIENASKPDSFAFEFHGWLKIPKKDVYRFYTYSDDGSRLIIDGIEVVNNDGSHGVRREDGKIALDEGFHEFRLLFFEDYADNILEIGYSTLSVPECKIPDSFFFTK
jgi:hypothetical protein